MADPSLEQEMRQVLMDLEMTSCGITGSYGAGNGGGAFASAAPKSGDESPPHVRLREQWNATRSNPERQRLLARARDELDQIRHSRAGQGEEDETARTARLLKDGEGFTAAEVALSFRMTVAAVERTRWRHGRDKRLGKVEPMQPMPDATPTERRERAQLLRDEHGMSTRQIAILLDVDQSTIVRDFQRHAA
jgi:DNA invertase Pin-like site-specific DNA recombinase